MATLVTLADLLAAIERDDALTAARRRNAVSSVRSLATRIKRDLSLPATFGAIRIVAARFDPLVAGISAKRWANIRSEVGWALRRYGALPQASLPKQLAAPWLKLRACLEDPRLARGLSRLIYWAARNGIPPEAIDDDAMGRFYQHVLTESLETRPNRVHQRTCVLWNRAVRQVPGWPQTVVKVPSYRDIVLLPLETFPPSFVAELDCWEYAVSTKGGLFNIEAPTRALKPASVEHRRSDYLRFASALVHRGYAPETVTGLVKLVEIQAFKDGLQYFYERAGRKKVPNLEKLAGGLVGLARHWVKVSPDHLAQMKALTRALKCHHKRGMTQKNLERLRQFDDIRKQAALINLPERLVALAKKKAHRKKAALLVQTALAIEIELMAPVRLANLTTLSLQRHFSFGLGGRRQLVYLDIPAAEVKNGESLNFELPSGTARLLALYRTQYRPLLVSGPDDGWLFPGAVRGHKHAVTLSEQICKAIARHAGLRMNVHLFRHLAAKLFLDANLGQYEVVRQILGHRNLQTTIDFYCVFEVTKAVRRLDEVVLKLKLKNRRGGEE